MDFKESVKKFFDTPDHTPGMEPADVNSNKAMGILSYLGILVLIPPFARFHTNAGLVLLLLSIARGIVFGVLGLFLGDLANTLSSVVSLILLAYTVLGIVYAAQGKAKELPLIGSLKLLK